MNTHYRLLQYQTWSALGLVVIATSYGIYFFINNFVEILSTREIFNAYPTNKHNYMIMNWETCLYAIPTLIIFSGLYFLIEKYFKRPCLFLLMVPLLYSITGHFQAAVATLLFFIASFGFGSRLVNRFLRIDVSTKTEKSFCDEYLKLFLGFSVNSYLVWLAMPFKINYASTYLLILCAELFLARRELRHYLKAASTLLSTERPTWSYRFLSIYGLFLSVYTLVPMYTWDELARHLYFPKATSIYHYFSFFPDHYHVLEPSILSQGAFTGLYLIGGEFSIRFAVFLCFWLSFFAFDSFTSEKFGKKAAFYSTLTLVLIPFIQFPLAIMYIDCFAIFSAAAIIPLFVQQIETLDKKKTNLVKHLNGLSFYL